MVHRTLGRLHVCLLLSLAALTARVASHRLAPQRGQGTVEYVALILLVAAVLAAAVTAVGGKSFDLQTIIVDKLKDAISTVSDAGSKK
jgi:hypothetical protein